MRCRSIGAWLVVMLAPLAMAQEAERGVARVSLLNGEVTTQRGDSGEWVAAVVNAPLVAGDKIYAARGSRAELQFDSSNFLRIGEDTQVILASLEGQRHQLQLAKGIITYRILRDRTADVEISTPVVGVRPVQRGIYRIAVLEDGQTEITVRDGRVEIASNQGTEVLNYGQTMIVRLGANNEVQVQQIRAEGRDEWDRWNDQRDNQITRSESGRYVPAGVSGAEDLDAYGNWQTTPGYGPVWYPRADPGWSPYSYGRWVWVDYYGWTWVGYEPWGWAPYHWGRWLFRAGLGWGWCPGPVVYTNWSPALVGFFGWGHHGGVGVGVGIGFGNIGWVPLAPGERFYPGYGRGRTVVNNVNIVSVTNINNVYRNAGVNGGVRSVTVENFGHGVALNHPAVSASQIQSAGQIRGLVPVVPNRQSLQFSNRAVSAGAVPANTNSSQRFFTNSRQPANTAPRTSFAEQQQQMARTLHTSVPAGPAAGAQSSGVTAGAASSVRSPNGSGAGGGGSVTGQINRQAGGGTATGGGWRQTGGGTTAATPTPQAANSAPQPNAPNVDRSVNNGWRRLGEQGSAASRTAPQPSSNGNRQAAPQVANPAPQPSAPNAGGNSNWRRLGQPNGGSQPAGGSQNGVSQPEPPRGRGGNSANATRESAPAQPRPQASTPLYGGRSESSAQQSGRQLEIHRPIITERSQQAAPAARSESRGSSERGGGGHGGGDHGGGGQRK